MLIFTIRNALYSKGIMCVCVNAIPAYIHIKETTIYQCNRSNHPAQLVPICSVFFPMIGGNSLDRDRTGLS